MWLEVAWWFLIAALSDARQWGWGYSRRRSFCRMDDDGMLLPTDPHVSNVRHVDRPPFPEFSVGIEYRVDIEKSETPHCYGVVLAKRLVLSPCMGCLRKQNLSYLDSEIYVQVPYFEDEVMHKECIMAMRILLHPFCYHMKGHSKDSNVGLVYLDTEITKLTPEKFALVAGVGFKFNEAKFHYLTNYRASNVAATKALEAYWTVKTKVCRWKICRKGLHLRTGCHNFLCAGYHHTGATSCKTDLGSAMAVYNPNKERFVAVGLLSQKCHCGGPKSMGNFIKMNNFHNWINMIAKQLSQKVHFQLEPFSS